MTSLKRMIMDENDDYGWNTPSNNKNYLAYVYVYREYCEFIEWWWMHIVCPISFRCEKKIELKQRWQLNWMRLCEREI